ncbi:MAG: DUF2330 domain-containing protein [Sandaracinaceae bacterium]|nr:DUF2330 domain-containing protein [Sandaracinaceae bacterium]
MLGHKTLTALALAALALPASASAFCGFYVAGSDEGLTNNASMVVMMRDGTTTVLSMQNDYEGPPAAFALVVPVPVVIREEQVRILPRDVFARVNTLASPRLVEYWEQDPCAPIPPMPAPAPSSVMRSAGGGGRPGGGDLGVRIEAQFEVGEYEIVILSARDSDGLETWLRREQYNIPEGASSALRPYVEQGTKFFVARVNVERVTFENGRAILSPIRVHYTSETFALPVRLGLLNSPGVQDLLVHILSREGRFDVANYENVTIPTNLDVDESVRGRFAEFYATLFDRTLERNPGAVVTEYAWQATSCDPCPGPVVTSQDLVTLGGDVAAPDDPSLRAPAGGGRFGGMGFFGSSPWVLTRLHYRYAASGLDEDLVFRRAAPIVGGREFMQENGVLEERSRPASDNNFQARYAIRHPWTGPIACDDPVRGRWGGPPAEGRVNAGAGPTAAAENTAYAPRGTLQLEPVLRTSAPEVGLEARLASIADILSGAATAEAQAEPGPEAPATPALTPAPATPPSGCGGCAIEPRPSPLGLGALLALALLAWRRR